MTLILTPQEVKDKLRKRLEKVLKQLPEGYWTATFIHKFPEYKKHKAHVSNVIAGRSLDETVIEKMEQLAEIIKPETPLKK